MTAMRKDDMAKKVFTEPVKIAPSDLIQKEFPSSFRGFDRESVKNFLEEVSVEYEKLFEKNREMTDQLRKYEDVIREYKNMETTIKNALISSQKFGEKLIDDAKKASEAILSEAKQESEKMRKQVQTSMEQLKKNTQDIQTQKADMLRQFRQIVQGQLEFLDKFEKDKGLPA